jgi:hypothetical protein
MIHPAYCRSVRSRRRWDSYGSLKQEGSNEEASPQEARIGAARLSTLVALGAGLVAALAWGDDIENTVDAPAKVMPLQAGGPNGTTRLYVVPQSGDGKNGCNLTGSTTLTVSVASDNPAVATVSGPNAANPSQVTFTSCVNNQNGPLITVTPHNTVRPRSV